MGVNACVCVFGMGLSLGRYCFTTSSGCVGEVQALAYVFVGVLVSCWFVCLCGVLGGGVFGCDGGGGVVGVTCVSMGIVGMP